MGLPPSFPLSQGLSYFEISSYSDFSIRVRHAASHPSALVWCNWEGKSHSWAGPLPSIESVTSGKHYANVAHLSKGVFQGFSEFREDLAVMKLI